MSSDVEDVLAVQNRLGEGPLWSVKEQALYWVDIHDNCFHRLYPTTGKHEIFDVGVQIGVLALRTGGLVMATQRGFAFWSEGRAGLQYVANPEEHRPFMRFNDGAADCTGRFWAASVHDEDTNAREGILYRLDPDGSVHIMESGLEIPNGMGWSPDNRIMYLTDSTQQTIFAYDFDAATGTITNRRRFIHTPNDTAVPDGLIVDAEGYIWSVRWGGERIERFTPDGQLERIIKVPALQPTCCIFGGANLDELYITSAWDELNEEERKRYPLSGDLFRVKLDIKGNEKYKFAG